MRGSNIEIFVKGKSHQIIDSMYLGPRSTSQNIFAYAEIITKKGLFPTDFRVTLPRGCTISGYGYPEVVQLPAYYT